MKEPIVTMEQLKKLLDYLADDNSEGSFRYLIYDVMGFEAKDYCDLYHTGLMGFKDWYYECRDKAKKFNPPTKLTKEE